MLLNLKIAQSTGQRNRYGENLHHTHNLLVSSHCVGLHFVSVEAYTCLRITSNKMAIKASRV